MKMIRKRYLGIVEAMGYKKTENIEAADLYIINTCCVRENAEEKVLGKLRRIKAV